MSAKLKMNFKAIAVAAAILSGMFSLGLAHGAVVQCGNTTCSSSFRLDFAGTSGVGTGELLYDATSGDISLNTDLNTATGNVKMAGDGLMWTMGDGSTITVGSLSGNADPILGFGLGASTTGSGSTFGFTFNLPIALEGPINADSSVSYSLTSLNATGAEIKPVVGSNIVSAFEVDTTFQGLPSLNKGVDVGDTFSVVGGPGVTDSSPVYTASNSFTGDLAYDLMTVKVDFSLTADSTVGLSGFVQQVVVPIPAAVWLFGSGLLGLAGMARRKKAA